MSTKRKGVLLTLGGAPDTPHIIEGLPGYFSPSQPRMVGEDFTLEAARQAVEDHGDVLELVDVPAGKAGAAETAHEAYVSEGRDALAEARRDGRADDDPSRTKDERNAVKEAS